MTRRATFGDFAAAATWHLEHLQPRPVSLPAPGAAADAVAGVRAVVHALSGCATDACAALENVDVVRDRQYGVWVRAAIQVRAALANADASWSVGHATAGLLVDHEPAEQQGGLRAAARAMTLGRDLLHTHLDAQAARGGSDWAPVITSPPVARALLDQVGRWAYRTARHAGLVAVTGHSITPADRHDLNAACRGLWIASWAVGNAQERSPVRDHEQHLLAAIPVAGIRPAGLPVAGDPVPALCGGIIRTAERLRTAARSGAAVAAWSPGLTRESLRQTAGCCAIAASSLHITLRTLAEHAEISRPVSASLADAAEGADHARAAWLRVAGAWDTITTDTRGFVSPAAIEAAALALWTGRLAYASPEWTPALGPRHEPRPAAELAASPDQLNRVVDAAHYACHTLAVVADADHRQVTIASIRGRLVVPTRSLPDSFDIPYKFTLAPGVRSEPLMASYKLASEASEQATAAIGEAAVKVNAPSQILGTWRTAAAESPAATRPPSGSASRRQQAIGPPSAACEPLPAFAGPVERILLDFEITSEADLQRAAAIDTAADQLILRAAASARPSQPRPDPSRSAGTAELITHLVVSEDSIPAALHSSEPPRQLRHMPPRQAEAEAGA